MSHPLSGPANLPINDYALNPPGSEDGLKRSADQTRMGTDRHRLFLELFESTLANVGVG